jgi:hypothetical protein
LDSLHGATSRDASSVTQLIKTVCVLNIGLYLIDHSENLIDVSELGGIISSGDYFDILVKSLIFEN